MLHIRSGGFGSAVYSWDGSPSFENCEVRKIAGQGMVFTFNMNNLRNELRITSPFDAQGWAEFGARMGRMASDIVQRVATSFPDVDFDYDYDDDYDAPPANTAPPVPPLPTTTSPSTGSASVEI